MTKLTEANVNLNISDLNSSDMQALSQILSLAGQAEQAGALMGGMDPMGDGMMGGMPGSDLGGEPAGPELGLGEGGELSMAGPDEDYGALGDVGADDEPLISPLDAAPEDDMDLGLGDDLGLEDPMGDPMAGDMGGDDLGLGLEDDMGMEEPMGDELDMMEGLDRIMALSGLNESEETDEEEIDEAKEEDDEDQLDEAEGDDEEAALEEGCSEDHIDEEEIDEAMIMMPGDQAVNAPMGQDAGADMEWMRQADTMGQDAPCSEIPPADPSVPEQDPAFMDMGDPTVQQQEPAFMSQGDQMRQLMDDMFNESEEEDEEPLDEAADADADAEEDEEQLDENAEGMYNLDLEEDAVAELGSPGLGDNREYGPYQNEMACMVDARKEIPGAMKDREVKLLHKPAGWFWSKLNEDATNSRPNISDVCTKGIENSRHEMRKTPVKNGDNGLVMEADETVDDIHSQLNEQFERFMKGE